MISADTLRKCAFLSQVHIEPVLRKKYPDDIVLKADFVGISNAGQFCYNIIYPDENSINGVSHTKVFVWLDDQGNVEADY